MSFLDLNVMKKLNWEHDSDYEYTKTISLRGWAWEALRRGKEYYEAYEEFLKKKEKLEKQYGSEWNNIIVDYGPPKKEGEARTEWIMRCADNGMHARELTLGNQCAQKFYLYDMYNPSLIFSDDISFIYKSVYPKLLHTFDDCKNYIKTIIEKNEDGSSESLPHIIPRQAVLIFDLRQDISPQLTQAKKLMEEMRNLFDIEKKEGIKAIPMSEGEKDLWRRHLRTLDALHENPKIKKPYLAERVCDLKQSTYNQTGDKNDLYALGRDAINTAKKFPARYKEFLYRGYRDERIKYQKEESLI